MAKNRISKFFKQALAFAGKCTQNDAFDGKFEQVYFTTLFSFLICPCNSIRVTGILALKTASQFPLN